ncbi:hotdog fold thioesterase [Legionella saoudiensis]|uniref:hotdog fold thioesterase n=1 Tax=Legionella saoudiensis TaxID=1750561 RepID=UPI000730256F|nr:hotdog fold thioesterase [Legionella saoudiensis]
MAIWFKEVSLERLNEFGRNTMSEFLGIQFTEIGDNFLKATMPVTERTKQPLGLLHGGANVALAETIASTAANGVVDLQRYYCVGLEINANHLRAVKEGIVTAVTTPIHIGKTTQVWEVIICNEVGSKTCIARMTAAVIAR